MKGISAKQKRFCEEYLIDCNATQAAVRAGYSPKTAKQIGERLSKNPKVKKYIDEQLEQLHNERIANAQEIIEYLTSVMRGESQAEIVVVEGTGDGCSRAIKIDKKPDEKERLKAAELLMKRFGMFKDKCELSGIARVVVEPPENWFIDETDTVISGSKDLE